MNISQFSSSNSSHILSAKQYLQPSPHLSTFISHLFGLEMSRAVRPSFLSFLQAPVDGVKLQTTPQLVANLINLSQQPSVTSEASGQDVGLTEFNLPFTFTCYNSKMAASVWLQPLAWLCIYESYFPSTLPSVRCRTMCLGWITGDLRA